MTTNKITGFALVPPRRETRPLSGILGSLRILVRARLERARERRRERLTAAALERLGARELRDIGLVRLEDANPPRYLRVYDFR